MIIELDIRTVHMRILSYYMGVSTIHLCTHSQSYVLMIKINDDDRHEHQQIGWNLEGISVPCASEYFLFCSYIVIGK